MKSVDVLIIYKKLCQRELVIYALFDALIFVSEVHIELALI